MKNDINLIIHKFIQGNATTEELWDRLNLRELSKNLKNDTC